MADYIAMDVAALEREVDAMIVAFPELAEDEALRADMIEGELDIESVMGRVVSHYLEAAEMVDGMKPRAEALAERKARYERRKDAMKAFAKRLLAVAGRDKITLPEATISITKGRDSVDVTDMDALPQGYFATERKADKTAIGNALKAGETIPGALLKRGDDSVSVRQK